VLEVPEAADEELAGATANAESQVKDSVGRLVSL
jgi:hypothetical protein